MSNQQEYESIAELWQKSFEKIKKFYRNITSFLSGNGTYILQNANCKPVFRYLSEEINPVGNKINQYLHTSDTFKEVQTNILSLNKGVFSYLNSNSERYVYLYGVEKDFEVEGRFSRKKKYYAHFFIEALWL
jgi:hypothetical protein